MNKYIFIFSFFIFVGNNTFAQKIKILRDAKKVVATSQPLTVNEVSNGLKETLASGVSKGIDLISKVDGYYANPEIKISFPQDMKMVEDKLRMIGMGKQVDQFVLTMNRGAEEAAKEAKPIFLSTIKQMTIDDAFVILKGQPDAATQYFKKTTTTQLKEKFKPIVQAALDKVEATKYYNDLVAQYNRIPFITKVNPNLNEYATDMAIQGLFTMIAKEEKTIRQDPVARTTDLLKKVFTGK